MTPRQTALGKLLRDSRTAAGLSRHRMGELIGISPYTIEGWELGRVAKPPIHDVLRLTHFLNIPADEIQRAVFEDAGVPPEAGQPAQTSEAPRRGKTRSEGAVPLLEAAFGLLRWEDDSQAADALQTTPDQVQRWRTGTDTMELGDYMTLTSLIGIAAAAAIKGDKNSTADLNAAARTLGLRPGSTNQR
jgi:transcriptional regulator with XRE-family HTH domain